MATTTRKKPSKKVRPKRSPDKERPNQRKKKPSGTRTVSSQESGYLGKRPISAVVYGDSGIGKTSFCSHFPGCTFVVDPKELGIVDLEEYGEASIQNEPRKVADWEDMLETIDDLCSDDATQTVVFDSLTGFEQLCFTHHCNEYFDGDWSAGGFYSHYQGPANAAKTDWQTYLAACDSLREAGKNVLLIAHSEVKTFNNPHGPDYDKVIPCLDRRIWAGTHRWAQAVFYIAIDVQVTQERGKTRKKANPDSDQRIMHTANSPVHDAKNRFGLEPIIDMGDSAAEGYKEFEAAMLKAQTK